MFGINESELIVLLIVVLVVVGPERLPRLAQQAARAIKQFRKFAGTAQERVREELADEGADIDFAQFDPRRYDPRRIVRDAITEEFGGGTGNGTAGNGSDGARPPLVTLAPGQPAPFDDEAT